MKINIEITEQEAKKIISDYLQKELGGVEIDEKQIIFEVKSKQNYKSEWEQADFRVKYHKI